MTARTRLCSLAMLVASCFAASSLLAQDQPTIPVKLQTVVGQKYVVKVRVVRIDRDQILGTGLDVAKREDFMGRFIGTKLDVSKFLVILNALEDTGIAKVFETPAVTVRSSAPKSTPIILDSVRGDLEIDCKVGEGDLCTTAIHFKPKAGRPQDLVDFRNRYVASSTLGESTLAISFGKDDSEADATYMFIVSVDYPSEVEMK